MFTSRLHIHLEITSSVDYIVLCCTKLCPLHIYCVLQILLLITCSDAPNSCQLHVCALHILWLITCSALQTFVSYIFICALHILLSITCSDAQNSVNYISICALHILWLITYSSPYTILSITCSSPGIQSACSWSNL